MKDFNALTAEDRETCQMISENLVTDLYKNWWNPAEEAEDFLTEVIQMAIHLGSHGQELYDDLLEVVI